MHALLGHHAFALMMLLGVVALVVFLVVGIRMRNRSKKEKDSKESQKLETWALVSFSLAGVLSLLLIVGGYRHYVMRRVSSNS